MPEAYLLITAVIRLILVNVLYEVSHAFGRRILSLQPFKDFFNG